MKSAQLTSLFFPAALMLAQPAQAARPVIDSIIPDAALTSITINGSNLGGNPARTVFLSGFATPLAVTSAGNSQIVAALPSGMAAGSYAVRVQGTGNGDFDEFFASFTNAAAGSGSCTSYSSSLSSGSFAPTLSVHTTGPFSLSAKVTVNTTVGPGTVACTLTQVAPAALLDVAYAQSAAVGSVSLVLQATVNVTSAPAQFVVNCPGVFPASPTGQSFYFTRLQAICLQSLVSPSP